ncbi:MAG: hypothetical protein ABI036_06500 [Fibrobacteria bacterium]
MLAFSRIPGNAVSFWIRRTLRWSRGAPSLPHESKENLFAYLPDEDAGQAEMRERDLRSRYRLATLADASTRALYRKNLYLLDMLEQAWGGLGKDEGEGGMPVKALDVGSQDWHYVFALERWLRYRNAPPRRRVELKGVEVDGYGIYPDFRSRKDYALAYAAQTDNPDIVYEVGDFLQTEGGGVEVLTWFYPFVTRHHLLLWGLPLRFYRPAGLLAKAAGLVKAGGRMLVFTHTLQEHALFLELGRAAPGLTLEREGQVKSRLVDFYRDVADRRYSVWRRI